MIRYISQSDAASGRSTNAFDFTERVNPFSFSGHVVSHLVTPGHTPVTNQQAGSGSRESTESALLVDLVSQFKKCGHKVLPFLSFQGRVHCFNIQSMNQHW